MTKNQRHASDKKEFIVCAAILLKEPKNNPCYYEPHAQVFGMACGGSHPDILYKYKEEVRKDAEAQGFMTSKGRFVGRKEAAKIAFDAGQLVEETTYLFSEDLY